MEEEEGKEPIIQFLKKSFLELVLMSQISKDDFLKIKNRESLYIKKKRHALRVFTLVQVHSLILVTFLQILLEFVHINK